MKLKYNDFSEFYVGQTGRSFQKSFTEHIKSIHDWILQFVRRHCLHDVIDGQIMKVERVGRRTQLLDDLRNKKKLEGGSSKLKDMEMTVYHMNRRKKYKLSSTNPETS